jgi:cbb3-type cytochrome oxidase subunit 1
MAGDLTLAGVFQGFWWGSLLPWDVSVEGSNPFWIVRVFAGLAMFGGQVVFAYNIFKTWRASRAENQLAPAA